MSRLRERRVHPWGRRVRDRRACWAVRLLSAALLAAVTEMATGGLRIVLRWMWAWLTPVRGL